MLHSKSDILYVRASLGPLARDIAKVRGVVPFLKSKISFEEMIVPHFYRTRTFWRARSDTLPPPTNSGALGKRILALPESSLSPHVTHAFVGFGDRVKAALTEHTSYSACFQPIDHLAAKYDFSMLLLGCVDESPGFSTVHASQYKLGLSQQHLVRYLYRWDQKADGKFTSIIAPESPGCSLSFGKFYPFYRENINLVEGDWNGVKWVFIPSARKAIALEMKLLEENGRFVDCGRWNCSTCRARTY